MCLHFAYKYYVDPLSSVPYWSYKTHTFFGAMVLRVSPIFRSGFTGIGLDGVRQARSALFNPRRDLERNDVTLIGFIIRLRSSAYAS